MKSALKFHQQLQFVLSLLEILEKRKTAHHIAKRLNISERTVYRWLEHLKEMGFQVEKDREWYWIIQGNNEMHSLASQLMIKCYPSTQKHQGKTKQVSHLMSHLSHLN